ncbi:hypothetical protein ACFWVC_21580 [Streptomyces sp. NPDC058691]|uniref:hypothetical protein n=1 Tax=Streptomyces sp. NPDC058691 TaxID=3346601 RepID=UPI003663F478
MQYSQLGSTGVFVSRVALDTMTFGGAGKPPWSFLGGLGYKESEKLIGLALDSEPNLIDTPKMI